MLATGTGGGVTGDGPAGASSIGATRRRRRSDAHAAAASRIEVPIASHGHAPEPFSATGDKTGGGEMTAGLAVALGDGDAGTASAVIGIAVFGAAGAGTVAGGDDLFSSRDKGNLARGDVASGADTALGEALGAENGKPRTASVGIGTGVCTGTGVGVAMISPGIVRGASCGIGTACPAAAVTGSNAAASNDPARRLVWC